MNPPSPVSSISPGVDLGEQAVQRSGRGQLGSGLRARHVRPLGTPSSSVLLVSAAHQSHWSQRSSWSLRSGPTAYTDHLTPPSPRPRRRGRSGSVSTPPTQARSWPWMRSTSASSEAPARCGSSPRSTSRPGSLSSNSWWATRPSGRVGEMGLHHHRIPPRSPNHNAVYVRFHGTVLEEFDRPHFHRGRVEDVALLDRPCRLGSSTTTTPARTTVTTWPAGPRCRSRENSNAASDTLLPDHTVKQARDVDLSTRRLLRKH